jgi:hypothetical protein
MKFLKRLLLSLCLVLIAGQSVWADPPHGRVGVYLGPVWGPFWYPGPWPHYPPPIIVTPPPPPPPPVYVEQGAPVEGGPEGEYWYYCATARDYYPSVNECPEGWVAVLPQAKN